MKSALKPTIPEVLPLVKQYYNKPGNSCGGNLHIVLDDGNINDRCISWCLLRCLKENDLEGITLCDLLILMSKTQRRKLAASNKS